MNVLAYPLRFIGNWLAEYLSRPRHQEDRPATCTPQQLAATLQKGDVLLVEGSSRISTAIKYLTQSTWSHAAIYVAENPSTSIQAEELIEADVVAGVRRISLGEYAEMHTRICRPVGLNTGEIDQVVAYVTAKIGDQYDLKNIIDLARYLIQTPPVPLRWRRRMLALGSGDPTKAICSSLIAQAFQSIQYPILPLRITSASNEPSCQNCHREILHIRHHSLFAPRDFDISPYFQIIKPTLQKDFDPHQLNWVEQNNNSTISSH